MVSTTPSDTHPLIDAVIHCPVDYLPHTIFINTPSLTRSTNTPSYHPSRPLYYRRLLCPNPTTPITITAPTPDSPTPHISSGSSSGGASTRTMTETINPLLFTTGGSGEGSSSSSGSSSSGIGVSINGGTVSTAVSSSSTVPKRLPTNDHHAIDYHR